MKAITPRLIVTYSNLFNDLEKITLEKLLVGYSCNKIIYYCSVILFNISSKNEFDFTNGVISSYQPDLSSYFIREFNRLVEEFNQNPMVFTKINCLELIQFALINKKIEKKETSEPFDLLKDLNLFKAFLFLNENYTNYKAKALVIDKNLPSDELYLKNIIPLYLPDSEFNIQKNLVTQSVKFKCFIDFIEINNEYKKYLPIFYEENKVKGWKQYLKIIWFTYSVLHSERGKLNLNQQGCVIDMKKMMNPEEYDFIDNISVNKNVNEIEDMNAMQLKDFKILRKYPFFKTSDDRFIISEINLLADKVFQSIQFSFCDAAIKEGGNDYGKGFKADFSYKFVHNYLFNSLIYYCFNNYEDLKHPGDKNSDIEYSDYYIRKSNKIFLFELKDHIMNANVKHSIHYELILKDITSNFIEPKGANQLVNVIENISKGGFVFDNLAELKHYKKSDLVIQPILVYTDNVYGTNGVNYIVNKGFRKLLKDLNCDLKVENIVMINLDLLIHFQDILHNNKISLNDVFFKYNKFIESYEDSFKETGIVDTELFTDFDTFFEQFVIGKNIKVDLPRVYKKISKEIFKE